MKKLFLTILLSALVASFALFASSCTDDTENIALTDAKNSSREIKEEPIFSFAVFGDNGDDNEYFNEILKQVNQGDYKFAMHTGDLTNGKSRAEMQSMRSFVKKNLSIPFNIAIGDNDLVIDESGERTDKIFRESFKDTKYSFDYENSHFIIFNNSDDVNPISKQNLKWLEDDLKSTNKKFKFIFMHVPVAVPLGDFVFYEDEDSYYNENKDFIDLVNKYNVTHIYTGHFHGYLVYNLENVPVTVTGGAGSKPQFGFESDYHYMKVFVGKDSAWEEKASVM